MKIKPAQNGSGSLALSTDRWHSTNTDQSDLSIVGTCDILSTKCVTKSCDSPDWLIQSCINQH